MALLQQMLVAPCQGGGRPLAAQKGAVGHSAGERFLDVAHCFDAATNITVADT